MKPRSPLYEDLKERSRARNAELSRAGRDIGELPPVADPARKKACERNFRLYCENYYPHKFFLRWSADHLKAIGKIERAVLEGGLFAFAMPRGSGKTSLCECAVLWAASYGHRKFVVPLGATAGHAGEILSSIKGEVETNDLLLADFPEICVPVRKLEGIVNRCAGQTHGGERTRIKWTAKEAWLPTIAGSKASGAIIRVAGITGRIRGMKESTRRPDLVLPDDPQTMESACSLEQTEKRERILAGDVLGLAGPGVKISGLMPCTIIAPDDLAARFLDRKKHPDWQGEISKLVYAFPADTKLWDEYAEIRAHALRAEEGLAPATAFYRRHQREMDEGAIVGWPERYNADEASALQHAQNLRLQDERAFFAEYQNDPLPEKHTEGELTVDQVAEKANGLPRGLVPLGATRLCAMIDVGQWLLHHVVLAVNDEFTGWVVDYGTYPEQEQAYFTSKSARPNLGQAAPKAGIEGAIVAGLKALAERLFAREWKREGGTALRIERCLIDANWGTSTDLVYTFCRHPSFGAVLLPSHGKFIGASGTPLTRYTPKPGERAGLNWLLTTAHGKRATRHVLIDTNYWKSFVHARLAVALGDKGCFSLFGQAEQHRLFAEHVTSEYRVPTQARGRTVDEWKPWPRRENHWLDCLVGAACAASIQGATLPGTAEPRNRKRVSYAEMQARQKERQEAEHRARMQILLHGNRGRR